MTVGPARRVLYRGALLLTLDPSDTIHPAGDLLVEGNRIAAVGPVGSVDPTGLDEVVPSEDLLILPGMVNAHTHSNASWVKGRFPGRPLELWRQYSRVTSRVLDDETRYLGVMLGFLEQLRTGTTALVDHFITRSTEVDLGAASSVRAVRDSGIRAALACNISDLPYDETIPLGGLSERERAEAARMTASETRGAVGTADPTREILEASEAFARALHDPDNRVICQIGPSSPQRCSDALLVGARELADRLGLGVHLHVLESKTQAIFTRRKYGTTAVAHLDEIGFLGPHVTMAHGVWIPDQDFERIARAGATVTHNPTSNLKLGSGVANVRGMLAAGVNVALGTDGAGSNDGLSMFQACHLAGLVHNHHSVDFRTWPSARQVLRLATRNGARALGPGCDVGSLEPGRLADFVGLNRWSYPLVPLNDPYQQIVYCENGASVDTVVIDGRPVMAGRKILTFDEQALLREAAAAFRRLEPEIRADERSTAALDGPLAAMIDASRDTPAAEILGHPRAGM